MLYHLALASDWEDARRAGTYRISTRGKTLDEVGFIHLSLLHQVAGTAGLFFADVESVVLLEIDPDRLTDEVRLEPGGSDELFPHLYGPLPIDAVVRADPYP